MFKVLYIIDQMILAHLQASLAINTSFHIRLISSVKQVLLSRCSACNYRERYCC